MVGMMQKKKKLQTKAAIPTRIHERALYFKAELAGGFSTPGALAGTCSPLPLLVSDSSLSILSCVSSNPVLTVHERLLAQEGDRL